MKFTLRLDVPAIAFAVASLLSMDSAAAGIVGGTLKASCGRVYVAAIPDSFVVTNLYDGAAGTFVIAKIESRDERGREHYLSELWLFPRDDARLPVGTFEDRKTLLSFRSASGEGQRICRRIVVGPYATAVQIAGWESEWTILFDNAGHKIELPTAAIASACACEPSYVEPVTWVATGQERTEDFQLLCHVGEEGGMGPFAMLYNPISGAVTVTPAREVLGELGDAFMRFFDFSH